ncbi:signal peptidase I [Clostridium thermosuccinogenes]|uniref:Signal peptidase I n=1 Tax=Clostridium thermosuccinogenes TaxID=84032 RepID=A0A2K2FA27_9CLOT|nr:signal peptidase I [Pseudoclostridium thermosuccinogenes]AUS95552.1 signal peptidase I [Pseudoclostridium thermosuccinogenes]PNT94976.1 signal peptidase I [Pseudoclostridium thermosuccinogenes]PNT95640.1 signal peptidase I [Pseudoclostridium thermosuccinogenes]
MGKREYEALIIIAIILLSLILGNTVLPVLLGSSIYINVFKPVFWLAMSIYIWKQPRIRFKGKLKLYSFILIWSAICGITYMSVYFAGGFMDGIGASPYSRKLTGILINVLSFGSVLLMMELVRNYIINRVKKKYVPLFFILVVLVFSLYRLNLKIMMSIETWQQAVQYVAEFAGPEIMTNILLTYMVYIGGAYPAIIYIALTTLPIWISPVLPNLRWITKAFIGIMMPTVFIITIHQVYRKQARELKLRDQKREKPAAWIAVSIFSIALIWFAAGVFPIFPTIILTGSMEPTIYPGDVALMVKTNGKDLNIGDVIQYWTGDIFIVHRIISIDEKTGRYQTKGDNNSAPDLRLVDAGQIRGKMVGVVPKIGMISVLFRSGRQIPREEVEF